MTVIDDDVLLSKEQYDELMLYVHEMQQIRKVIGLEPREGMDGGWMYDKSPRSGELPSAIRAIIAEEWGWQRLRGHVWNSNKLTDTEKQALVTMINRVAVVVLLRLKGGDPGRMIEMIDGICAHLSSMIGE